MIRRTPVIGACILSFSVLIPFGDQSTIEKQIKTYDSSRTITQDRHLASDLRVQVPEGFSSAVASLLLAYSGNGMPVSVVNKLSKVNERYLHPVQVQSAMNSFLTAGLTSNLVLLIEKLEFREEFRYCRSPPADRVDHQILFFVKITRLHQIMLSGVEA
jgi:hypothetical protein